MTTFMDKDFLLNTETARKLYHDYAASCPIIDYHCHISPKEIWEDQRFENITKVWLGGDHYKWRLMRCAGVDEYYITGGASDYEKFCKWAEVVGKAIGNPLYHWTHLELQRFFGYHGTLSAKTADEVWNLANETLQKPGYTTPRPDCHEHGVLTRRSTSRSRISWRTSPSWKRRRRWKSTPSRT